MRKGKMKASKRELSSVGAVCLFVSLVFWIRMVVIRGTWLFEIRFYFWVMRKHVSHFVWWNVWLQTNSFIEFVVFLHVSSCLPHTFSSLTSSCPCVVQTAHQCMVGKHWEKHKSMGWFGWMSGICEEGAIFWACFYRLTAVWLHLPFILLLSVQ